MSDYGDITELTDMGLRLVSTKRQASCGTHVLLCTYTGIVYRIYGYPKRDKARHGVVGRRVALNATTILEQRDPGWSWQRAVNAIAERHDKYTHRTKLAEKRQNTESGGRVLRIDFTDVMTPLVKGDDVYDAHATWKLTNHLFKEVRDYMNEWLERHSGLRISDAWTFKFAHAVPFSTGAWDAEDPWREEVFDVYGKGGAAMVSFLKATYPSTEVTSWYIRPHHGPSETTFTFVREPPSEWHNV